VLAYRNPPSPASPFCLFFRVFPSRSSIHLLVSHICACQVNPMEPRPTSPPLSDGSSVRSIESNRYSLYITDQFINPAKFYKRLDRLLGPNEYTCDWRQNFYIIKDAKRTLSPVSASLSLACSIQLISSADRNRRSPPVMAKQALGFLILEVLDTVTVFLLLIP
jgi:hypothetical protein